EASAFFQAANRLTIFVGPPLAGILIGVIGNARVLYVDAATYLVSFLLVALFVHPPEVAVDDAPRGVLDGVRFMRRDALMRMWMPALTLLDICWQLLFAALPVLVVTSYAADPHILGWLFGALGGGALIGAFVSLRTVRRWEPLTIVGTSFLFQMGSIWLLAVPGSWLVRACGMALAGFFMSNVNAPLHSLLILRIPREIRMQTVAASGVFQSVGSPIGLLLAGAALTHFATHTVLAIVLAVQTVAVLAIVGTAFSERTTLRAAAVDSPA
ncbi:MAG TPA: MFS transporter, partial [Gaiellaceae bacterium]|nr:MFS transporter [Gaiellaceae bacterium]